MDLFPIPNLIGSVLSLAAIIVAIFFWRNNGSTKQGRYPPGPGFALPLLGHLLQLGSKPHLTFLKWKEKYGPLIYFKMGTQPAIIVNDAKVIRDLLTCSATTGRPISAVAHLLSNENHGILASDGKNWEEQRPVAVRILRELGVGGRKGNLEEITVDEARSLLSFLERRVGRSIQGRRLFNGAVISGLWAIITGQRFEWCDEEGNLLNSEISSKSGEIVESVNKAGNNGLVFFSWLRFLAPERLGWNRLVSSVTKFQNFMEKTLKEQVATMDSNYPRHLIDHFLIRIQSTEDPNSTFYKDTGRKNLLALLADLFMAGSETTSTSMEFGILYLSQHPEVQSKLQLEIDRVLGGRFPSLADRATLPYTQAVILEILRHSAIILLSAHRFTEDFTFQGYLFRKNTLIFVDLYTVLHDTTAWGPDWETFRPSRFLNEEETQVIHREGFLPFGSGKRNCIGESLAKDTLFLFLTSIFQKFTVELYPKGVTVDYNDVIPGFTMEPPPFEICVNLREQ